MGRFEKWGGWAVALAVGVASLAWVGTVQRDADSYREIAGDLKKREDEDLQKLRERNLELADARRALDEALEGAGSLDRAAETGDVSARLVGHWRLVSFENFAEDGGVTKRPISGRIMYDAQGNMAAQLMPGGDAVEVENRRTRRYVAYFGAYEVDAEREIVTHRPEGSVIFPWVGGELVRYYSFSDGRLELSLKNEGRVTGTLTWERIE